MVLIWGECLKAEEEFALCIAAPLESVVQVSSCCSLVSALGARRTFPKGA